VKYTEHVLGFGVALECGDTVFEGTIFTSIVIGVCANCTYYNKSEKLGAAAYNLKVIRKKVTGAPIKSNVFWD